MELIGPLCAGAVCLQCSAGTVTLKSQRPSHEKPGHSEMSFHCTLCQEVAVRLQDNRFM
jgi:hypothetical protein